MAQIISIHSFRGGTGKSNTTANVAALLATDGRRVGVVDTDIQSPGIHVLFGMAGESIGLALNDYLWGKCDIAQAAHDVTSKLGANAKGKLYLIPSSIKAGEITRVLREGYDAQLLTRGFRGLIDALGLDALLIDTHPGLGEETLLSMVISHTLAIVLRPDQQDYEGTGVTVQVARKLKVPNMVLIVNKVPAVFDQRGGQGASGEGVQLSGDRGLAALGRVDGPGQRRHLQPAVPGSSGDGAVQTSSRQVGGVGATATPHRPRVPIS